MESLKFRYQNSSPYSLHESISLFHEEFRCQLNTFSFTSLIILFLSFPNEFYSPWKRAQLTVMTVGALGKNMGECAPSLGTWPACSQLWKWQGCSKNEDLSPVIPFSFQLRFSMLPSKENHPLRLLMASGNVVLPIPLCPTRGCTTTRDSSIISKIFIHAAVS